MNPIPIPPMCWDACSLCWKTCKSKRPSPSNSIPPSKTAKDRYFTSASANPASVFPTLLRLAHHHIEKSQYGHVSDRRIKDLLNMLDAKPFPTRLTLEEQGVFVLGYYHQRAAFYAKKDNGEETNQSE
ncbi:type I-C CRISPR-associated protein Cas8c/Csd1 [Caldichromatium japonicum]